MEYYKKINISQYDVIVPRIQSYLENKDMINSAPAGFLPCNAKEIIEYCPQLYFSLIEVGLQIKTIGIYRTTLNSQAPIHIDHTPYKSRLNIPIMNCQYSSTVFYQADVEEVKQQKNDNLKYIQCVNAIEIDRVTVDQPTILRIDHPHQVIMDEDKFPRICLTVGCYPDPMTVFTTTLHNL
jgi:hypothetical protein